MAVTQRRPEDTTTQPPGVEGDGMDPYPTYRDGPGTPHEATATKPTDVALPRSRRTYAFPILIGLAVFALIIVIRIVWGGINMAASTDDAMAPGAPASPPAAMAPAEQPPTAATGTPESQGSLDRDVQAAPSSGPGNVEPTPGAIDVPGGATTTPPQPATTP